MRLTLQGMLNGSVVYVEGHPPKFLGIDASDIEHLWNSLKDRYNVDDRTLFMEAPHLLRSTSHIALEHDGYEPHAESTIKREVI